jgi:5-methylcytosine-specific restriction endonuclease McrA
LPRTHKSTPKGHFRSTSRWRKLRSKCVTMMPWCLDCGRTDQLEADHILPAALFPELIYEPLNTVTRCRTCNARRGTNYTEAEERRVRSAIQARTDRNVRRYASQSNG